MQIAECKAADREQAVFEDTAEDWHGRMCDLLDLVPAPAERVSGYLMFIFELHRCVRRCAGSPAPVVEQVMARWRPRGLSSDSMKRLADELCRPERRRQYGLPA